MPLELFKHYIDKIRKVMDFQFDLDNACHKIGIEYQICMPDMVEEVIDLLEYIFQDNTELIAYWIFDLDFGELYYDGCIARKGGERVKLKTIEDLYEELCRREGCDCLSTEYQS